MKQLSTILLVISFMVCATAQAQSTADQISAKRAELESLQRQQAAENAPAMYGAMAQMTEAASQCVADGIASKGSLTRTASVSKACREQAMLGAFSICAITVAQTGDTRDLNQCTAMMKNGGQWQQVWMRGLGVAGAYLGGQLAADVVLKGAVPLGLAAINKTPVRPEVVDPVIVDPLVVDPLVVEPTVIQQEVIILPEG
jgi:hypothetical protein